MRSLSDEHLDKLDILSNAYKGRSQNALPLAVAKLMQH